MEQPNFTEDFHYLVALIQHLGAHEKWNSRTPRNIADSTGLMLHKVDEVLTNYPAFFRRSSNLSSQNEPLYALHIRYARRKKTDVNNSNQFKNESEPLSPDEMQTLLGLVTNMVGLEAEDKRFRTESKHNNIKIWVALFAAILTAICAIFTK